MKAILLAAGVGTRLRPITNHVPKCLVPIGTRPLLRIWLEHLAHHGVTEVLVNTHHLADQVRSFAARWSGYPKLTLSHETSLLGSAGTLVKNWDFVAGEDRFVVCYADNLTDIDLGSMVRFHDHHSALVTMALFRSERPRECGIVSIDDTGLVLGFEEKPAAPKSDLANGGVYVMSGGVRSKLPSKTPADIGFDLLPRCVGQMYGWPWSGVLIDIGSVQSYRRARHMYAQPVVTSRNPA